MKQAAIFRTAASSPSYRVQVPARTVLAVRGWPLVIGCTFPPANSPPALPGNLVITWQRLENNQVVHSFYYGQDQMNYQSQDYQNRTTLFNSQISSGNASLRLTDVRLQDAGRYLCSVSDSRGMDKAEVQVQYAGEL
uniref:Ig-like domain-containing protein n=1 Tax=Denticeps clupeoides TaxID=299321 RepID=A0AAY4AJU7_9TELE